MQEQAGYRYDLFVLYADADRAWVEGYLLDALEAAGVRLLCEEAFRLGVPRVLEFERAVKESQWTSRPGSRSSSPWKRPIPIPGGSNR